MTGEEVWDGTARLIDRAGSLEALRAHGLHLLASERWRELGADVPRDLALDELLAVQRAADAAGVLRAARTAYDGEIVLLKGPEIAAYYPSPTSRPWGDLDLLVADAERAHENLRSSGFELVGSHDDAHYDGLHHLKPLRLPGFLPTVEVHRRPNWVSWAEPPSTKELISAAVPAAVGVPGIGCLPPTEHAVVAAAHAWEERPFRRLLDLIDVSAMAASSSRRETLQLAERWGLSRMWKSTMAAADALLYGAGTPWSLRTWGRDVRHVRCGTVLEDHIRLWFSPFWCLPPHRALLATLVAVGHDLTPAPTETWANKLTRARAAVLHPMRATIEHAHEIGPQGIQPRFKRR